MTSSDYQKQWRQDNPERAKKQVLYNSARQRARVKLALKYPNEYLTLLREEYEEAGLPYD